MSNDNVHPIFKGLLDSISGETLPTSEGDRTIPQVMDSLMWGSYKANRGYGLTHEQLVKAGIGTPEMKIRYEQETKTL